MVDTDRRPLSIPRGLSRRELLVTAGLAAAAAGASTLAVALGRATTTPVAPGTAQKLCIPIYTDPTNDETNYTQAAWLRASNNSPTGSYFIGNVGASPLDASSGGPGPATVATTVLGAIAAGTRTVTPVDMTNIVTGMNLVIEDDTSGTAYEVVVVSAVVGATFSAAFANPHGVNFRVSSQTAAVPYQGLHQFSITNLHTLGKFEIGYVDSNDAVRPLNIVNGDIEVWWNSYNPRIDGIFIDRVNATVGNLSYYTSIYNYIKAKSAALKVWFNPGVQPDEGYMAICDVIMNFESDIAAYDAYTAPAWNANYAASRFMHIITSTGSPMTTGEMYRHLANSRRRNCGYFYATPELDPPNFNGDPVSVQWAAPASFYMAMQSAVGSARLVAPSRTAAGTRTVVQLGEVPGHF